MDFTKIYQLKGMKPKNKDHTNFYECCDLTEKVYLKLIALLQNSNVKETYKVFVFLSDVKCPITAVTTNTGPAA